MTINPLNAYCNNIYSLYLLT